MQVRLVNADTNGPHPADLVDEQVRGIEGPAQMLVADAKHITAVPTIITDERLAWNMPGNAHPAFDGFLSVCGDTIRLNDAILFERFFVAVDKITESGMHNPMHIEIFSKFYNAVFPKIIKIVAWKGQNSSIKVRISVLDLGTKFGIECSTLRNIFGMTVSESRLAGLLLSGMTLNDAAEHLNVRISTVREQLSSIFAKTGTSRQAELFALLSRLELILA